MKKILLTFSIALIGFFSSSQVNLDSLYTIWQNQNTSDSVRLKAFKTYIWDGFLFSQPDSAITLSEQLFDFAEQNNYPKARNQAYTLQAIAMDIQGNHKVALSYYKKSLKASTEIGDQYGISENHIGIGALYSGQGNEVKALEHYQKALAIDTKIGNKGGMAMSLNNIGNLYNTKGSLDRALNYYERSLAIDEELGVQQGVATALINIGVIYKQQGNLTEALEIFERSLQINQEIDDQFGIASCLESISDIYYRQNNYDRSIELLKQSIAINKAIGYNQGIRANQSSLGLNYFKKNEYKRAISFCKESFLDNQEEVYTVAQKNALNCLYQAYKELKNNEKALIYLEKLMDFEQAVNAQELSQQLDQMEFDKVMLKDSLEQDRKARLIEEAHEAEVRKKDRTQNILVGSSLLLFILAGGLYGRWRIVHKSREIISKEKDRSENLLLNILPAEIAEELKEKGSAQARDFDLVSILFTDFKGFTAYSQTLSASQLVEEINQCFKTFDEIIGKYEIEKIKTIGDAYMAAGGLPTFNKNSVKNTVLAALEMQDFITKRKKEMDAEGKPAFEMRLGIHTGPVVAGIVGIKKFQYDVWGDTVNTASRIESNGEIGKVNLSQSTYDLLKHEAEFKFVSRGKIEAKGKGEIEMYFVSLKQ